MESSGKTDCAAGGGGSSGNGAAPVAPQPQPGLRRHIVTWLLSVLSAIIVGAAWVNTHPPRIPLAMVDLNAILSEEIAKLDREVTPGMTDAKKRELADRAQSVMKKIDVALNTAARECGCTLVSVAAVAANGAADVRDLTWRVRELVAR